MLLRFNVENFLSFKDRTYFSMIPGKVRRHANHVVGPNYTNDFRTLKTGIIYGPNASGKSNLIKAMAHAQEMILKPVKASANLAHNPFRLDSALRESPSRFEFEIRTARRAYAYGFMMDASSIVEEWLYVIDSSKDEEVFVRGGHVAGRSSIEFRKSEKLDEFLQFTARGTPKNRLFLSECIERNVVTEVPGEISSAIEDVYTWFKDTLSIVFPSTKYGGFEMVHDESKDLFTKFLRVFDTGIDKLELVQVEFPDGLPDVPRQVKDDVMERIQDANVSRVMIAGSDNLRFQVVNEGGEIQAHKIMAVHHDEVGGIQHFDINEESDGTQRIIDLLPGLLEVLTEEKVYVVDEFDRSLHSDITTTFLDSFFKLTNGRMSQLIVTTHETNLLDQDHVRKDEIWFTERCEGGSSRLYGLEEFKPRFDKDIKRGYLAGRFGALPSIRQSDLFALTGDS